MCVSQEGFTPFFSLNKTNVHDRVRDGMATLETLTDFRFERPAADRKKQRSVAAVMEAFPDVRLVIDTKEQPIRRPQSTSEEDRQKPYYSGKKKRHTLKTQIGVEPDGQIGAVSDSVPGGAHHDLTLLRTTRLVEQLDAADEAGMLDKAYVGAKKEFPDHTLVIPFKASRGHPLTEEQKAFNRQVAKYRIVVEHTNAQLNIFQVLAQVYRHARESHTRTVRVVAMLVNRRIRERPLKSYPAAAVSAGA